MGRRSAIIKVGGFEACPLHHLLHRIGAVVPHPVILVAHVEVVVEGVEIEKLKHRANRREPAREAADVMAPF